ncbi:MAG TPA: hypothetical protein VMN58_09925 [Acidimicrobiales bacterium]|nr:hypothetical protein [Acidimicrobiales bacterium]
MPPAAPSVATALPWLVRLSWLALPFAAGPLLAAGLHERAEAVRTTASVGLWLVWALVLVAVLVPRPVGLTALRVAAPAALAAGGAAVAGAGEGPTTAVTVAGLAAAALVTVVALLPETGAVFVNGAAYGDERRLLLRAPGPVLAGPIVVAWALLVAGVATGPLLLAAGIWVAGAVALAAGWAVAVVLARAIHSLAERWVVFVPAGMVLKDHLALVDPVLFRRVDIEALRPAPADTDALDLTARSPGLALELLLLEKVPLLRATPGRRESRPGKTTRLLFTPTRPGAVLAEARRRRIAVG